MLRTATIMLVLMLAVLAFTTLTAYAVPPTSDLVLIKSANTETYEHIGESIVYKYEIGAAGVCPEVTLLGTPYNIPVNGTATLSAWVNPEATPPVAIEWHIGRLPSGRELDSRLSDPTSRTPVFDAAGLEPGIYSVIMKVSNPCGTATVSNDINIQTTSLPAIDPIPELVISSNARVTLTATSASTPVPQFAWATRSGPAPVRFTQLPSAKSATATSSITFRVPKEGTYTFSVSARNKNGRSATMTAFVIVDPHNFTIIDDKLGTFPCTSPCTKSYAITSQADLDNGSITNVATATTAGPEPIVSTPASVTVTAIQHRDLMLSHSATPSEYSAARQAMTFTYKLRNAGNVTLSGPFWIDDDKLGTFACGSTLLLAPGAATSCTANYLVRASDIRPKGDALITNAATAADRGRTVLSNLSRSAARQMPLRARIASSETSCHEFANDMASSLEDLRYGLVLGAIRSISPKSFRYYRQITAPDSDFRIQVQQSDTQNWKKLMARELTLWDALCEKVVARGTFEPATGTMSIDASGLTRSAPYYLSVRFNPGTLRGQRVPDTGTIDAISLKTLLNGESVANDSDRIDVRAQQ